MAHSYICFWMTQLICVWNNKGLWYHYARTQTEQQMSDAWMYAGHYGSLKHSDLTYQL